jgi:hypothetical protein
MLSLGQQAILDIASAQQEAIIQWRQQVGL